MGGFGELFNRYQLIPDLSRPNPLATILAGLNPSAYAPRPPALPPNRLGTSGPASGPPAARTQGTSGMSRPMR